MSIHAQHILSTGHLLCAAGCIEMTDTESWAPKRSQPGGVAEKFENN